MHSQFNTVQSHYKTNETSVFQDWDDEMKISKEAFAEYASKVEADDFEDDLRNLSSSLHLLVGARRDSIRKLRSSAEYLDSVWVR